MSRATILDVRLLKCSCAMKMQKDVIANMGDIEIYDFMRAGERRIYYFAYEVSIYSEKIDFQENVNKKMTACSWYLLE